MGAEKASNISEIKDDPDEDEPGEVIESAAPLKIGEERDIIHPLHLKKKLLKQGHGYQTPKFTDEITLHYVATTLLDHHHRTIFASTRHKEDQPLTITLGHGQIVEGLDDGILTMKKGEIALFTIPSTNSQYEVELLDWITVIDICSDGGIIKKVIVKGEKNNQPGDLDQVTVKYKVMLDDGALVVETPEEGVEFYVQDGHFCPAIPKALKTMKRGEKIILIVQPQYAFAEHGLTADNGSLIVPANSVINIHLELISFKPVIDVTHDAKVLKKILREGEGSHTADEGATVHVRYTARLEDGTIFEKKGYGEDELFKFIVDEEQVIAGLDRAAATMKKSEIATVTVTPDYGYNTAEFQGDLAIVPPSSVLVYDIEMVDFTKEKLPSEMNNHERVEVAEKKKEEGNMLFKKGKYQRAERKYDKAADYIDEDFEDGDEKLPKSLRVSCWLNHAACSLKLNNFQEAINFCSKVLEIDSVNVKALYRRAQAYVSTSDLDLAELDTKKALEIDPHNRELISLRNTLKQVESERNKQDAKLYVNMFAPRRTRSWVSPMDTKRQKIMISEDENTDCGALGGNED